MRILKPLCLHMLILKPPCLNRVATPNLDPRQKFRPENLVALTRQCWRVPSSALTLICRILLSGGSHRARRASVQPAGNCLYLWLHVGLNNHYFLLNVGVKYCISDNLQGQTNEIFDLGFFHLWTSLSHWLLGFNIFKFWLGFCRVIQIFMISPGYRYCGESASQMTFLEVI